MKNRLTIISICFSIVFFTLVIISCKKADVFNNTTPFSFIIPPGFPATIYNFQQTPLNKETIELGRQLFYEGRLSKDGSISCGSCHNQVAAFTSYDHDLSHGYNNSHTSRNAPVLFNLAWYQAFQHDGSSNSVGEVALNHIIIVTDMGGSIQDAIWRLQYDTLYKRLFREAYGTGRVTSQRILNALTQFTIQLVSANSKYDKVKRGEETFSTQEQSGYQVFQAKCNTCHKEPLFTDLSYRNIGLSMSPFLQDKGRMAVTLDPSDSLKFRVPTLRNIMVSSYYTHDGRLSVIRSMINHYRTGVVQSATLDPLLINGINLTDSEVESLVAFFRTLTDTSFLNNPHYANP